MSLGPVISAQWLDQIILLVHVRRAKKIDGWDQVMIRLNSWITLVSIILDLLNRMVWIGIWDLGKLNSVYYL